MIASKGAMEVIASLTSVLPLDRAMPTLLAPSTGDQRFASIVGALLAAAPFESSLSLQSALWLYVDDLERAHTAAQSLASPMGSMWHAIVHRREGDFANSRYWLQKVSSSWQNWLGSDPAELVSLAEAAGSSNPPAAVLSQRSEWQSLLKASFVTANEAK